MVKYGIKVMLTAEEIEEKLGFPKGTLQTMCKERAFDCFTFTLESELSNKLSNEYADPDFKLMYSGNEYYYTTRKNDYDKPL